MTRHQGSRSPADLKSRTKQGVVIAPYIPLPLTQGAMARRRRLRRKRLKQQDAANRAWLKGLRHKPIVPPLRGSPEDSEEKP